MTRSKKLARIKSLQEQIHKRAEYDLVMLQAKRDQVREDQHATLRALATQPALRGLFTDVIARRLKGLAVEEQRVAGEIEMQKAVVTEHGLQMKRTERMLGNVIREERREHEKLQLVEIMDSIFTRAENFNNTN